MMVMLPNWKVQELIYLVRQRYPDWADFAHPPFAADEVAPKRALSDKAQTLLNQATLDELLANGDYTTFINHLKRLSRPTNLLWQRIPRDGDTAVLHQPQLDLASFCSQMRNLLHGNGTAPERLQIFSDYLQSQKLPNKWPFATYFLFLYQPQQHLFVKPRTINWLLKFNAPPDQTLSKQPTAVSYHTVLTQAEALRQALAPYGAEDFIDVQSFVWVCERESKQQTGHLDHKSQIELDMPPTDLHLPLHYATAVAEPTAMLQEPPPTLHPSQPRPYTLAACATDTGWPEATLHQWSQALERKGQIIFYGPPATGKTFVAQKLAEHVSSRQAPEATGFWELIQFHPAYAYESFVQGLRPLTDADGRLHYQMVHGRFRQFCQRAAQHHGRCVLIIDEINRANLASVFGELMYLLEYRNATIQLAEGEPFAIPANVRLIGTMNTADRSIALVDHALRRRFAFIQLPPNHDLLRHYHRQTGYNPEPLIQLLDQINQAIADPHYSLGNTFFMQLNLPQQLPSIWQTEIEPYLEEYFFDQPEQVERFRWSHIQSILPAANA